MSRWGVERILYPALFTATLALAAALFLGPATAKKLLSVVGVAEGQTAGPVGPAGYGDGSQYTPGVNTGPNAPYDHLMTAGPTQPTAVAMPQNWAGGNGGTKPSGPVRPTFVPPPGSPPAQVLESAKIIARVGPEIILAADLNPSYQAFIESKAAGATPEQVAAERQEIVSQLNNLITIKLLFIAASNDVPAEGLKEFHKLTDEDFDKKQLKAYMDRLKVNSEAELDAKLREYGTSLERKREFYFEQCLAAQWKNEKTKSDKDIDFDSTLVYYHEHKAEFEFPAQANWEQLSAPFASYDNNAQAYRAIVEMGNRVLSGQPFAQVAKQFSKGPTADKGGDRDWTTKGALVSKTLDAAIFSPTLPVGRMSTIIEDADGYHIIRLIERRDAGIESFLDAQKGIKKKLTDERSKKMSDDYIETLRKQAQIWTIFDNDGGPLPWKNDSTGQPAR